WTEVDDYLSALVAPHDDALDAALHANDDAGLPHIDVTATQGKLLHILARTCDARRVLEVGTLGGYSTIWLARALPDGGQVVTLEIDPKHARVARSNVDRAGVGDRVDIRVGPALDTLTALAEDAGAAFDLTFIDADKPNTPEYFGRAVALSRRGSLVVVDNVVREGEVANAASTDDAVRANRELMEIIASDARVTGTAIQTVGSKGYDGFVLAIVN
ncbi:MAG: O-methyltransferase, partial [Mycobacteriales bacterium]